MIKQIPVERWSRVCGYYRSDSQFNPGKKEEFRDRHQYTQKEIFKNKKFTEDEECKI